jgi:ribosomal protein L40E
MRLKLSATLSERVSGIILISVGIFIAIGAALLLKQTGVQILPPISYYVWGGAMFAVLFFIVTGVEMFSGKLRSTGRPAPTPKPAYESWEVSYADKTHMKQCTSCGAWSPKASEKCGRCGATIFRSLASAFEGFL